MVINIRTLRCNFLCRYYIGDELFCFQPILNLVVWIAVCLIIAQINSKTYFMHWIAGLLTAYSSTKISISTYCRYIQAFILLKYLDIIGKICRILTHSYIIISVYLISFQLNHLNINVFFHFIIVIKSCHASYII